MEDVPFPKKPIELDGYKEPELIPNDPKLQKKMDRKIKELKK